MQMTWEQARAVHPILRRDGVVLHFDHMERVWDVYLSNDRFSSDDLEAINRAVAALNDDESANPGTLSARLSSAICRLDAVRNELVQIKAAL